MMKFVALILIAAATPAIAQEPAPQTQKVEPAKKNPLDKIVCRTEEGLGSRLNRKKVCMSLGDWKAQADDARNTTERMQQMNADQMKPDG